VCLDSIASERVKFFLCLCICITSLYTKTLFPAQSIFLTFWSPSKFVHSPSKFTLSKHLTRTLRMVSKCFEYSLRTCLVAFYTTPKMSPHQGTFLLLLLILILLALSNCIFAVNLKKLLLLQMPFIFCLAYSKRLSLLLTPFSKRFSPLLLSTELDIHLYHDKYLCVYKL